MLPWGHGSVGYLLYSWYGRTTKNEPPAGAPTVAVLVGTQFPDLVDKPLAWTLGVIPSGRLIGHSLLVLAVVWYLAYRVAVYYSVPELGIGFGIGAVSHAVVDALPSVVSGTYGDLSFLLWPVLPAGPADEHGLSIIAFLLNIDLTVMVGIELVLTGVALVVWWADDTPGLGLLKRALTGLTDRVRP